MAENSLGKGRGSERSDRTPGTRGLRAIETAVLRVRESQGNVLTPTQLSGSSGGRSVSPSPIGAGSGEDAVSGTVPRFPTSIGALVLLAAVGIVVLALVLTSGPGAKPTSTRPASAHQLVPLHSAGGPTVHSSSSPNAAGSVPPPSVPSAPATAPSSTTASPPLGLASGDPVITSLDPAVGQPGQQIVVIGSNFLSSSGQVVAAFNGETTATSCSTSTTCSVTVPPSSGAFLTQVTITTARGTSNSEAFVYGGG